MIRYADFENVEMQVGRIVAADPFPEARKRAYKLTIDFGPAVGVTPKFRSAGKCFELPSLVLQRPALAKLTLRIQPVVEIAPVFSATR